MKEIKLTKGYVALVDDDDFKYLSQYNWIATVGRHTVYAIKSKSREWMHRVIMNTPKSKEVDHIDGNGLNNSRSNLRNCSHKENSWNRKSQKGSISKYVGVSYDKFRKLKRWRASLYHEGKFMSIGVFKTEREAALARDKAILRYRSDFAKLNILKRKK